MDLLQWVNKILTDRGCTSYGLYPHLVIVAPSSTVQFTQVNDTYFIANAFTSGSLPIDGEIIGFDDALALTPALMQTKVYKHQHFTGKISISNHDTAQTMYVELLIASPRPTQQ